MSIISIDDGHCFWSGLQDAGSDIDPGVDLLAFDGERSLQHRAERVASTGSHGFDGRGFVELDWRAISLQPSAID